MAFESRWRTYVPVAQRRARAEREISALTKSGATLRPIHIKSRAIATSFWGIAWCDNLNNYADWANRMPRGRSYARNGSILDLQINPGRITSLIRGSSLYKVDISIEAIEKARWTAIRDDCSQQIQSLMDLMRGKLPDAVLKRLTDAKQGMFPGPKELKLKCSCPDYATMCKHVAATLYGVGHLLDTEPALFFKMRRVDQTELVSAAMTTQSRADALGLNQQSDLATEDLSDLFGIEFADAPESSKTAGTGKSPARGRKRSATAKTSAQSPPKPNIPVAAQSKEKAQVKKATKKAAPTAVVGIGRSTKTKNPLKKKASLTKNTPVKKASRKKAPSVKPVSKTATNKKATNKKKASAVARPKPAKKLPPTKT